MARTVRHGADLASFAISQSLVVQQLGVEVCTITAHDQEVIQSTSSDIV